MESVGRRSWGNPDMESRECGLLPEERTPGEGMLLWPVPGSSPSPNMVLGRRAEGSKGKVGKEEGKGSSRLRHLVRLAQTEAWGLTPEVPSLEGVGWGNTRSGTDRRASEPQHPAPSLCSGVFSQVLLPACGEGTCWGAVRERFQEKLREEALQNFLQSDTASCPKLLTLNPPLNSFLQGELGGHEGFTSPETPKSSAN